MSNIKSLILGSAATLVAFAGAQAADLPVKAKAVQYVKICSLYGAGFYYIPGTETCLKIGGYVAAEYDLGYARGSETQKYSGADGLRTRDGDNYVMRGRTNVTFDTRTATEYGVVRTFYQHDIHFTSNSNIPYNSAVNSSSWGGTVIGTAFVQFAGFTFGKAIPVMQAQFVMPKNSSSFFGYQDMSAPNIGELTANYTAELGNGLSITVGIADQTYGRQPLYDAGQVIFNPFSSAPPSGAAANNIYGGNVAPDFVANVKFDQAWGSVFGAVRVRDLSATYTVNGATFGPAGAVGAAAVESNGHPADVAAYGFVGGFQLKNLPTGPGDALSVLGTYSEGMTQLVTNADPVNQTIGLRGIDGNVGTLGYGNILDAVTGQGQSINKTKAYGVQAAFEHYWVPGKLRTSVFGSYAVIDYGATANALLCGAAQRPGAAGLTLSAGSNCNFDIRISQVGSRSVWTPVSGLDFQAEVLYTHFDLPLTGTIAAPATAAFIPAGQVFTLGNQNALTGQLRVIRTF